VALNRLKAAAENNLLLPTQLMSYLGWYKNFYSVQVKENHHENKQLQSLDTCYHKYRALQDSQVGMERKNVQKQTNTNIVSGPSAYL